MDDFRWMILVPSLFLATAAHAQNDAKKLDQMAQKLKKQCENQGGKFVLESVVARHNAVTYVYGGGEGRLADRDSARSHPNGGTAYEASGRCVTTMTFDLVPPKP